MNSSTATKPPNFLDQIIEAFSPEEFPKSLEDKKKLRTKLTADRDTLDNALTALDAAILADVQDLLGDEYTVTSKAKTGGGKASGKGGRTAKVARAAKAHPDIDQGQVVRIVEANGIEPRGDDQTAGTTSTEIAEALGGVAVQQIKGKDGEAKNSASQALRDTLTYMAAEGLIKHNGSGGKWSRYLPVE